MRSPRRGIPNGPVWASKCCPRHSYLQYSIPILRRYPLRRAWSHEKNARNSTQPETAMYATLTLPAGQDLDAPRRSPTVRVRSADELRNALRQGRGQALTLDASGLDRVLHADAARGLLEVQAATSWSELAGYLSARGIALDSFASLARLP